MRKIDNIQVARGVAALIVFLFHFHSIELLYGDDRLTPQFFNYGRFGVDLFFVISGFIMVYISGPALAGFETARGFLVRRVLRIYPLYWFVTLGVLAVWLGSGKAFFDGTVAEDPNILASLLLWPHERDPVIHVGWTLIHELYFYIVFAALLFAPPKWRVPAIGLWGALIGLVHLIGAAPQSPLGQLITHPLSLEFVAGAFIAVIRPRFGNRASWIAAGLGVLYLIGTIYFVGINVPDTNLVDRNWYRVAAFGPPAAFFIFAIAVPNAPGKQTPKVATALGDWSYGLYLVHFPIIAVTGAIWAKFSSPGLLDNAVMFVVSLSIIIIASWVLHVLVEKPSAKLARHFG